MSRLRQCLRRSSTQLEGVCRRTAERHAGRSLRLNVNLCEQRTIDNRYRSDGGQIISAPTKKYVTFVRMLA